jgi:hypothetical protein
MALRDVSCIFAATAVIGEYYVLSSVKWRRIGEIPIVEFEMCIVFFERRISGDMCLNFLVDFLSGR